MKRKWGSLERRGRRWFVRYREDGQRKRAFVGTVEDLGEKLGPKTAAGLIDGVRAVVARGGGGPSLHDFLSEYEAAYQTSVRPITYRLGWPNLLALAKRLGGRPMRGVDYQIAERFLGEIARDGIGRKGRPKPSTLRAYVGRLAAMWDAAGRYGYVDENPWRELMRRRRLPQLTRRHVPVLTADECRAIEAAILSVPQPAIEDAVLRQFVCLLFETGLRRAEALALRRTSIRGDLLDVRSRWVPGEGEGPPKTRSSVRTIKLTAVARAAIEAIPARRGVRTSDRLFAGFMRNHSEYERLRRKLRSACLRAGIPKESVVSFHGCRHVFAVRCVMAGVPLFQVSKILGHANVSQTQIYADHLPENFAVKGVEKLEAAEDQRHDDPSLRRARRRSSS